MKLSKHLSFPGYALYDNPASIIKKACVLAAMCRYTAWRPLALLMLFCLDAGAQDFPGLDTAIQRIVNQSEFLGTTILVAKGDKIVHHQGYGIAHPGFNVPATTETKYFVQGPDANLLAGLVMKFVEQKKIGLNDLVSKHLPNLPAAWNSITIKHLLTCTSGIIDYHYLGDPFEATLYQPKSRDEAMSRFIDKPLTQTPGSGFDWSISNFSVLCAVLERVSGKPYAEMLQEFLSPLKLQHTGSIEPGKVIPQFTNGYEYDAEKGEYRQINHSLFSYDPVICLYSTAEETFRFCRALANGTLISRESYALMTSREEVLRNNSGRMGYLLSLDTLGGYECISNRGGLSGYTGAWWYIPKLDATILVLCNSWGRFQHASGLSQQIIRFLLGTPVRPVSQRKPLPPLQSLVVNEEESVRVSGTYYLSRTFTNPSIPRSYGYYKRTVRVFKENGGMMIQYLGELPEPFLRQSDSTYRISSDRNLVFRFPESADGRRELVVEQRGRPFTDRGLRIGEPDIRTFHGTTGRN